MKTPRSFQPRSLFAAALGLAALFTHFAAPSASAATRYFDGGSVNIAGNGDGASQANAGTWDLTIKNWDRGVTTYTNWVNSANDTAEFNSVTGTATLGANVTVGGINCKTGASGNTIAAGAGPYTLTLGVAGNNTFAIFTGTTARSMDIDAAVISISGRTMLISGGTLTLNGTNSLAGNISVNGSSPTANLTIGGSGYLINGVFTGTLAVVNQCNFTYASSANQTLGGVISGAGNLVKNTSSSSTLTLNATNTYSGPTTISAGTLQIGGAGLLGSGNYTNTLTLNGTLRYSSSAAQTIGGIISGSGALTKDTSSASTLTLSNANTFTGTTRNQAGILSLNNAAAIQNSTLNTQDSIAGDAANGLRTTVTTLTIGGINGNKDFTNVFTTTSGGYSGLTALRLNVTGSDSRTYPNDIGDGAGGMTLTKIGTGTQILSGINTYTGNTTNNAGRLQGVTGGSLASAEVVLTATATNSVSITDNTKGWTNVAFTAAGAGTLEFDFGAGAPSATVAPLQVTGAATFTATPTVRVVVSSALAVGTYPLMTWGSGGAGAPITADLTMSQVVAGIAASLSTNANTLSLVIATNVKADNSLDLTNSASWTARVPAATEVAVWNSTIAAGITNSLGADLAFGGIAIANPGGLVAINAGNTLTLGAAPTDIDMSTATADLTLNCDVALGAANDWNVTNGQILTVGGVVSGSGTLTKSGAGTATLSGANTFTNQLAVRDGTLNLTGNRTVAMTAAQSIDVGGTGIPLATVNVGGDLALGATQWRVGVNGPGTVNQTNGQVSFTGGTQITLGITAGQLGTYNLSGGTITNATATDRGILLGVNASCSGIFNLSGSGTVAMASGSVLQIGRSESSSTIASTVGTFTQTGGTATVGALRMGGGNSANSNTVSTLNLSGGTFSAASFGFLSVGNNSTSSIAISGTANVTLPAFPTVRGSGSQTTITFDGGTLRNSAVSANYMSSLTAASIKVGGARFNTDKGSITIAQQLLEDPGSTGGGLIKEGTNTLTLSGAPTYTGSTLVSAGKLVVPSTHTGTAAATVAASAALGVTASGISQWLPASLTLGNPCTLEFNSVQNPGTTTAPILPTAAVGAASGVVVNVNSISGAATPGSSYPLLGNMNGSTNGYTLGTQPTSLGVSGHLEVTNSTLVYVVDVAADVWAGTDPVTPTVWDNGATTNWIGNALLNTPVGSYTNSDFVVFDDSAATNTVTIEAAVTPSSVVFNNTALSYTVSSSSANGIGGSGGLTMLGSGTVTLSTSNSYSGGTINSGGITTVGNNAALGTGPVTINSGTTRLVVNDGITITNNITINGGGSAGRGLIENSGAGNATLTNGVITISGGLAGGGQFASTGGGTLTVANPVNVTAPLLVLTRLGTVIYSGGGNYTNFAAFNGITRLGANNGLSTNASVDIGSTGGGNSTLDLAGFNQSLVGITKGANTATITNSSTTTAATLTLTGSTTTNFAGAIKDDGGLGKVNLTVNGGNVTLSGTSTYSGATTVTNGILQLLRPALISSTVVTVPTSGTLLFNNNGAVWGTGLINPPINLNGGTLTNYASANHYTVLNNLSSGAVTVNTPSTIGMYQTTAGDGGFYLDCGLQGSAALTVNADVSGAAVGLVLRTTNSTYSGIMTVNGVASAVVGTGSGLVVGANGAGNACNLTNATITVNGTMAMGRVSSDMSWANNAAVNGATFQMDALNGPGVVVANFTTASSTRTLSLGNNNGSGTFSGEIAAGTNSTLSLIKNGIGTQTLSGTNTYTGTTTVNAGTLLVNSPGLLSASSAVTINTNGTLGGNGTIGGSVTVADGGNVAPGASPGILSIGGNLDVSAMAAGTTGKLRYELGATNTSDKITVGGTLTIGSGVLGFSDFAFTNVGGLQNGTYKLITSGALVSGTLDGADLTNSIGSATGALQITGNDLELVVTGFGPSGPSPTLLTNVLTGTTLALSWPAGQSWRLQEQTNSRSVGLRTNWVYVTDSSVSSTNITVDKTKPTTFYRLVYP